MTGGTPASSFAAVTRGTPVLSGSGTKIGSLEHVLDVPELDIFEGIVVATHHGLRFIDVPVWCSWRGAISFSAASPWRKTGASNCHSFR